MKSPLVVPFGVGSVHAVPKAPQGLVAHSLVSTMHTPPTITLGGGAAWHVHWRPAWQAAPVVQGVQAVERAPQAFPVVVQTPDPLHLPPASQVVRPCVHAAFTLAG